MVQFDLALAVDGENGDYDAFITDLRNRLGVGGTVQGVPVLTPQVPAGGQHEFFDVNLTYTDRGITSTFQARFRTDNLYLVRYRQNESSAWQELDGNENYSSLTRDAGRRLEQIDLSSTHIGVAIRTLGNNVTEAGQRARALLTLILSIAEAARFRNVSSVVSNNWYVGSRISPEYASQIRSWARLSSAVQRAQNPGHTFDFNDQATGISTLDAAIAALGIMLSYTASRSSRPARDVASVSNSAFLQGQPLLEIMWVRINNIYSVSPGQVYGTINVTDSAGCYSIWNRDQNSNVEMYEGDNILLEGPSNLVSAADEFYIDVDLKVVDPPSNASIAKGTLVINPRDTFTQYDAITNWEVSGKDGSVTVGFVPIFDGLYAEIAVILTDGDGKNPASVYEEMTVNSGYGKGELFRKKRGEHVDVRPKNAIPSSRTVVAVPTTGTLQLHANLWDYDNSSDGEIAFGDIEFQPLYKQSQKKTILGESGEVEVRVSWM